MFNLIGLLAGLFVLWTALVVPNSAVGLLLGAGVAAAAAHLARLLGLLDAEAAPYRRAIPLLRLLAGQAASGLAEALKQVLSGERKGERAMIRHLMRDDAGWSRAILTHAIALGGRGVPVENERDALLMASTRGRLSDQDVTRLETAARRAAEEATAP